MFGNFSASNSNNNISLFNKPQQGSNINNNNQQQQQQQQNQQPQQGFTSNLQSSSSSSSLFSNPQNSNISSSLFGAQKPSTNNLFSSPSSSSLNINNTNNNNQQQQNGLFGSNNNNSPLANGSSSLFNNNQMITPSSSSNNLFNNNQINKFQTSTNFGSQPASATPSMGLFGSSTLSNNNNNDTMNRSAPPSFLNGSTNSNNSWSGLKSSGMLGQLYRRPIGISNEVSIQDRILRIYSSWNVSDPQCQFQHFFYNVVPTDQIHLYGRPNHMNQDDPRWQRAKRNNPDPNRFVPTLAIGFEDLSKRVNVQQNQAKIHLLKLEEISNRLDDLIKKHNLQTLSRLHKLKTDQTRLTNRLMNIVTNLMNFIRNFSSYYPHQKNVSSNPNMSLMISNSGHNNPTGNVLINGSGGLISEREEELAEKIFKLKTILDEEIGRTKVGELWARLNQLKTLAIIGSSNSTSSNVNGSNITMITNSNGNINGNGNNGNVSGGGMLNGENGSSEFNGKWNLVDEREIKKVLEVLMNQQRGIDHLMIILKKFKVEISIMRQSFDLESNLKPLDW